MRRLQVAVILLITFYGAVIGANNTSSLDNGRKSLDNRAQYCEWISQSEGQTYTKNIYLPSVEKEILTPTFIEESYDKVFSLVKKLAPHRNKAVPFKTIPTQIENQIKKKMAINSNLINKMNLKLKALKEQSKYNKRDLASHSKNKDFVKWKIKNDDPILLESLKTQIRDLKLQNKLLKEKMFSDISIYRLMRDTFEAQDKYIPEFVLILKLEKGVLNSKIKLFPAWMNKGSIQLASDHAFFEVSGSMISKEIFNAFEQRKMPVSTKVYAGLLESQFIQRRKPIKPSNGVPQVRFIDQFTVLVKGHPLTNRHSVDIESELVESRFTSVNNSLIDSFLDLACIKDSKWMTKLISRTEEFLNNDQLVESYPHEKVDEDTVKVLSMIKRWNPDRL